MAGRLVVIQGCMFAGKTGRLIALLHEAQQAGAAALAFKHQLDARYHPDRLVTHDGRTFPALAVADAAELRERAGAIRNCAGVAPPRSSPVAGTASAPTLAGAARSDSDGAGGVVIGIDEAQFFGRALAGVVAELRGGGCDVIVAGIHHDAWGQDFPPLPELAAAADEAVTLHQPCGVCGRPAEYTQRVAPLAPGDDMVGGPGAYAPRCGACFVPLATARPVYR